MDLNEYFIKILNVQAVFGLKPFHFNGKSKKFETKFLNFMHSLGSFIAISVSLIILTIMYRYGDGESNLGKTANFTIFSQDTLFVLAYNAAMINWLLMCKVHVNFLNKYNEMGIKLKVKLNTVAVTPATYYKKSLFAQISIIVFSVFLTINQIVRDIRRKTSFEWSICVWNIIFATEILTQMLTVFYMGHLTVVMRQYFDAIFKKLSKLKQFTLKFQTETNEDLLLCIKLFDELIGLKNDFSKLFGHQLLIIFSFEFVDTTISFYFILMYAIETSFSVSTVYLFSIYILPQILMFICLIHHMHQLAQVVKVKTKIYRFFKSLTNF